MDRSYKPSKRLYSKKIDKYYSPELTVHRTVQHEVKRREILSQLKQSKTGSTTALLHNGIV